MILGFFRQKQNEQEQQSASRYSKMSNQELATHLHAMLRNVVTADKVHNDELRATPNNRTRMEQSVRNQERAERVWREKRERNLAGLKELYLFITENRKIDPQSLFKDNTGTHNLEQLQKYVNDSNPPEQRD